MPPFIIDVYLTRHSGWAYIIKNRNLDVIAGDVGFDTKEEARQAAENKF